MASTIDRLDIAIHVQYARRTEMIEQIQRQYHLEDAHSIPPQAMVVDFSPRMSEIDILMGVVQSYAPWAYFYPPKKYFTRRRSSFNTFRVAPSLGSLDDQEETLELLEGVECHSTEEQEQKSLLMRCMNEIDNINDLIGFVIGRIGQFLQG